MQITFNGLTMGDGTLYPITGLEGDDSLPDISIGMVAKPRRDGSWLGTKLAQKRVITISFHIMGDPNRNYYTAGPKNALVKAFALKQVEQPLVVDLGFGETPFMVRASVTSLDLPKNDGYHIGHRSGTVELTATDPRRFATTVPKTSVPRQKPVTGWSYGQAYGFKYHATPSVDVPTTLINDGDDDAEVTYTILGPARNPSITLNDGVDVREIRLDYVLAAGNRLVLDTRNNAAFMSGMDMLGYLDGALLQNMRLRPGSTQLTLRTEAQVGEPTLEVEWNPTV